MFTLLPQMRASTAKIMFEIKSQPMIERVATFPARQCHGRGRKSDKAAIIATGANSGCIAAGIEGENDGGRESYVRAC